MKKLLILFSIVMSLFLCGCTNAAQPNICTDTREWDVFDTSKEHALAIYNYHMQCIIDPAFSKNKYTDEVLDSLILLADKLESGYMDKLPNHEQAYKEVILKIFINIFGKTAFNVEESYKYFKNHSESAVIEYEWYIKEAQRLYGNIVLQQKLNTLINSFEKAGYFRNSKIVDMFSDELYDFIELDKSKNLPVFNTLLFRVSKYNIGTSGVYDAMFFGNYYYDDKWYYIKNYSDKK